MDDLGPERAPWGPVRALTSLVAETRHLLQTRSGRLLAALVGAIAVFTLVGLLALWPHGWHPKGQAGKNHTVAATVQQVLDRQCAPPDPPLCRTIVVSTEGHTVKLDQAILRLAPKVAVGDKIRVTRPGPADRPAAAGVRYEFVDFDRRGSLLWIGIIVAALAVVLLRWRGILAVLGVVGSLAIVVWFLIPAILAGQPPVLVAVVASLAVMFITLVLTNGVGAQTLSAALGISATLGLTALIGTLAVHAAHLGTGTELTLFDIAAQNQGISLTGITLAAMLVGALGVLADTAVTQASAVMALRRAAPGFGVGRLFREAFVVGRDHMCATIHTLVLAYAGATLPLLLTLRNSGVAGTDAWNNQAIAEPIVATAVGCLALIVAVPIATGLAAALVARLPLAVIPEHGHHHH